MEKTDFSRILKELSERGINDYKLSEITGIERTKLTKLRTGVKQQPYYDDGIAIMKTYNSHFALLE